MLNDGIDVEVFVGMELNILPCAILLGLVDRTGFPILYQLLRSILSLFDMNKNVGSLLGWKGKGRDEWESMLR